MSPIASSSRRRRIPLGELDISLFHPSTSTSISTSAITTITPSLPSPISLPSKRGSSSLDIPSSPGGSKSRKVSRTKIDGSETIRKTRSAVDLKGKSKQKQQDDIDSEMEVEMGVTLTPRVKHVLERDDLGTGKSPVRRLFVSSPKPSQSQSQSQNQSPISGISGAISTPPSKHLSLPSLDSPSSSSSTSSSSRMLFVGQSAPFDPQSSSEPERDTSIYETDCGFSIYNSTKDELSVFRLLQSGNGEGISRSSSPNPSEYQIENQENIQPISSSSYPPSPRSKRTTPSRYSSTSSITSTSEDEIVSRYLSAPTYSPSTSTSGSGTRRRERSKLINEVLLLRGEGPMSEMVDNKMDIDQSPEEELTPGKKILRSGKGRERLTREVDMA
ncbi:uncharacterized protein IL334_000285 [Kwoniella shivajii]|uniref:Uncharacterized protein n=1 Tax=Kwoniella shivajii TaxID=564305 RepID=A0ABZ1CQ93_9TREE|nr:hypothetical protein IL334_000285 [Kwoniella shivajii]